MSRVYQSIEEVVDERIKDLELRTKKMWAIWGTADISTIILESGAPTVSGSGAVRRGSVMTTTTMAYGEKPGRAYVIGYNEDRGMYDFLGRINDATLDEIYLIVCMAKPEIINLPSFQNAIKGRLAVLEQTIGKEKVDLATERVNKVFDMMKDAVKYNDTIYYPAGYTPDLEQ